MGAVEHALAQLPTCTPVVDAYGGTTFDSQHSPLFTALEYMINSMAIAVQLPPWLAKLYYRWLKLTPAYKKHFGALVKHVDT